MPHEVDVELGRGDESLGAHGALPLPLLDVAWPVAAAVPLAGEVAVDVAAHVGLEVRIGSAFLSAVADVHVWMFWDTFGHKSIAFNEAEQSMIHANTMSVAAKPAAEIFTPAPVLTFQLF